jgi:hypothetical protein
MLKMDRCASDAADVDVRNAGRIPKASRVVCNMASILG